ncbi:putative N-acetyltransferase domain-containing protein [Seiridium unicorne]|uniref:N-acetyltransferase domain-containing protein n=1 Tax=Seiridium unicorne TaxID=138068 RepID=A0ABR2V432_9PEZI
MPTYKIERCTVEDAAGLARNNMSAFWTDPTWILIWEEGRSRESVIEASTGSSLSVSALETWFLTPDNSQIMFEEEITDSRAHKRHLKAIEVETGTIVGYVRFVLPDRLSGDWLDAQTPDATAEEKEEFAQRSARADWTFREGPGNIDEPVGVIKEKYRGRKEYMELDYLAVQPAYRHRGIASMLVAAGVAESERMGIDIFMLAYKAGLGVYKRLGFNTLETLIIDDTPWGGKGEYGCYFMERTVKKP